MHHFWFAAKCLFILGCWFGAACFALWLLLVVVSAVATARVEEYRAERRANNHRVGGCISP